jgi:DNA-binding MarR family transcriptional regulator
MLRAYGALVKALDAELEAAHGLPLSSYEVLLQLDSTPDCKMRMCDLASSVQLSRSGLTRLADRLERDGLIERKSCDCDARGAYAALTPRGREVLKSASPTHHSAVRERFLSHFGDEELADLAAYWRRVLAESEKG